jgi:arginine repressor
MTKVEALCFPKRLVEINQRRGAMKKVFMLLMTAVLVFAVCGVVYAAGDEGYTMKGEVVSIDSAGKTVVIDTTEGQKTVVFQESTQGFETLKPGMSVEMTCIDLGGKACAKVIKPIEPIRSMEGKVVSIDPEGKTVVIKTTAGEEVEMPVTATKAMKVGPAEGAGSTAEMLKAEPMAVEELKPGQEVKVDCFDAEGKFCANIITVVEPEAAAAAQTYEGEVTSIDSANKAVVISTEKGAKTLYYQEITSGPPMSELEVGSKIKAYCLDVEGKACIKDITKQ